MTKNKGGRPELTIEQVTVIADKLEPYLKIGLKLYKACLEADVDRSMVYKLMERHPWFKDKIETFSQYLGKLGSTIISKEMIRIANTQEKQGIISDKDYYKVLNAAKVTKAMREEFGNHQEVAGPDGGPVPIEDRSLNELESIFNAFAYANSNSPEHNRRARPKSTKGMGKEKQERTD